MLTESDFTASTRRRGNGWDNACSEGLSGSLNVERLNGQGFMAQHRANDELITWLLGYNQTPLHSTLAHASPMRFEQDWPATQAVQVNS